MGIDARSLSSPLEALEHCGLSVPPHSWKQNRRHGVLCKISTELRSYFFLFGPMMSYFLFLALLLLRSIHGKPADWLINDVHTFPEVSLNKDCEYNGFDCIELSNSLISRKFIISPNFFTVEISSHLSTNKEYVLRSPFSPEAVIGFDHQNYSIGGVSYINNANTTAAFWDPSFLNKDNIAVNESTFLFESYSTSTSLYKPYEWTPGTRGSFTYIPWPPKGLQLNVVFKPSESAPEIIQKYLSITVQYEMSVSANRSCSLPHTISSFIYIGIRECH